MEADFEHILITRRQIAARVDQLADEIARGYAVDAQAGPDAQAGLVLVAILSGSLIFTADLIRRLPLKMRIALIAVSAYRGTQTQGARILKDLDVDVTGRHVLIIDDILDTGGTLRLVRDRVARQRPQSLRTCVLLRKPSKAPPDLPADFVGFDVPDVFVVGYGLDYNDLYRNCPDIGVLRKELYSA